MTEPESCIKNNNRMEIPNYAIEAIARSLLPIIQTYYESEKGKQELLTVKMNVDNLLEVSDSKEKNMQRETIAER